MLEIVEILAKQLEGVELQQFTDKQKVLFKNNYNCKLYFFEYGLNQDGNLIVKTNRNNYNNLLYYMGLDGKSTTIKMKIEVEETVIVIYGIENERVSSLAKKLDLVS
ncbi:DUF3909 family protein [Desulforamulus aquiferis]|uniref:DUF3909 family protein n=1 Tax=Desulforamulus aquiferis TaxID=1397668 RepID=A0AAW7ZCX5_9FIRM|nr:DUF3909 family protein [Desulforamulus aquiferis]MDO7787547.1 DUF3909 family protein [Desulforamulus aquiferis]RYD01592.1 hypothetical protein N752_28875 [Desulforamulus aquiferis]